MWTFPKADDAGPCLRLELDMLHEFRDKGVTKHELAWAKRYLVRSTHLRSIRPQSAWAWSSTKLCTICRQTTIPAT